MLKKLLLAGLVLLGVAFALYLFPDAAAAQTVPLSGEAWSDVPQTSSDRGAGWIRFSGTAQNGSAYGVVANQSSGNLSGFAWSENYGWLSFQASDVSGCPQSNPQNLSCQPNINPSTGVVSGWARFVSAPTGITDAWNGWVDLRYRNGLSDANRLVYNSSTQQISGYAWGDSDIGWVRFCKSTLPAYCVTMPPLVPPEATINVTTVPANATWTITPGNITGTGDGTVKVTPAQSGTTYSITAGATPSGYDPSPTITNTQGGGSSALLVPGASVGFTITYTRSFDYSLSSSGNINVQKAGIPQNGQNTVTATLAPLSGPGQGVTLSVSGAPSGVTTSISGQGCVPTASTPCTFTLAMSVPTNTTSGTYPITVTGLPLDRTTSFDLIITDSPNIIVSCTASPSTAQVGNDVTWTAAFVNNPNPNPPYTYSWSGSNIANPPDNPAGQSFVISYSTTGVKQATVTVWDSLNNQAICPTGYITIGANPDYGEF